MCGNLWLIPPEPIHPRWSNGTQTALLSTRSPAAASELIAASVTGRVAQLPVCLVEAVH